MLKHFIYNSDNFDSFLDDPDNKLWKFINNSIMFLVFAFLWALVFESMWDNAKEYKLELFYFDAFVSSVFALEYLFRFFHSKNKLQFPFTFMRIIDLLSFLPFFLGLIAVGDFLKTLRLLRVLRVLRLVKKIPLTAGFLRALKDYLDEYRAVFLLFFVTWFLGSYFVYFFENGVEWTDFVSIPDSLWWGLVTMTTVGYGDMVVQSWTGKILASMLIFLGPLLIALTSAVTIMVFTEAAREHHLNSLVHTRRGKNCPKCSHRNITDAHYCVNCGERFEEKK